MTIERTFQGYRVSTVKNGYRISMHYIGYSRAEAIEEFRAYLQTK